MRGVALFLTPKLVRGSQSCQILRYFGAGVPSPLQCLLAKTGLDVQQVEGAGRGIFALRDFRYGDIVHEESPVLCVPSLHARDKVCFHCLRVLTPSISPVAAGNWQHFCSTACQATANKQYLEVYTASDFTELENSCQVSGERFPLLALRAACMLLSSARSWSSPDQDASTSTQGGDVAEAVRSLDFLSYVNVGAQPPPPWRETHQLLRRGVERYLTTPPPPDVGASKHVAQLLTLEWWTSLLARLHINCFRIDGVFPLPSQDSRSGLEAATAALLGMASESRSGSAVYLLASMFNHSCLPNLTNGNPYNDGTAVFTAARDITSGEELTITYINNNLPVAVRQEQLLWAYGFNCSCDQCQMELHA